jgi:hypothetical protein
MKTVRTTNGVRTINASNENAALIQLKEILTEHRKTLITRLTSDLNTYISYRFNVKPDNKKLEEIKDQLYSLSNSSVDLDMHEAIIQEFLTNENVYVSAEPFYFEIDEKISWELNRSQMTLLK